MASGDAWVMQVVQQYGSREEAAEALPGIVAQDGCLGARVIGGSVEVDGRRYGKGFAVQAFFPAAPDGAPPPDGCRRVLLPSSLASELGVPA